MKVKAIKPGYYGERRRKKGEVFEVEGNLKASWFEPADEKQSGPKKAAGKGAE